MALAKGRSRRCAEGVPILLAFEDEVVHPAVAAFEHLDELVFHLLPVVVAPEEEGLRWRRARARSAPSIC